jgi:glycosyltransferase involved in cell wall biosynthesis
MQANQENTLSVVIVTYNRSRDLEISLNSLFSMEVPPFQVIVVDSNSTDGTRGVAERYNVQFVSIRERSMVKARNVGLSLVKGTVVAYVDDDIIASRSWSKYIVEPYREPTVGGVGGRVVPTSSSKSELNTSSKFNEVGRVYENGFVLNNYDTSAESNVEVDTLIGCNMSFRTSYLRKAGGFDENFQGSCFREDTDVSLRVKSQNCKLVFSPKALVWHRYKGKAVNHQWFYWYTYNHFYFCFKNLQPIGILKFIGIMKAAFFPPIEYVKKSGIKLKPDPRVAFSVISGILTASAVHRKNQKRWLQNRTQ